MQFELLQMGVLNILRIVSMEVIAISEKEGSNVVECFGGEFSADCVEGEFWIFKELNDFENSFDEKFEFM